VNTKTPDIDQIESDKVQHWFVTPCVSISQQNTSCTPDTHTGRVGTKSVSCRPNNLTWTD